MANIKLASTKLKQIRTVDERLMSYNIEMTEVTGCPIPPVRWLAPKRFLR